MAQYRRDKFEYLPDNKTLFEVVMLADEFGNPVGGGAPSGVSVDAFGRVRQSTPLTLFDSFNRYQENNKFSTLTTTGGSTSYNVNTSSVAMTVNGTNGASVIKETNRVFAYQPGKSLQIFNTFVMDSQTTGLRQRIGYYNDDNGIFIELADDGVHFVKRTSIGGSVQDFRVTQTEWNVDPLDGEGRSHFTLDITKAQIFWMDIEWLGVGSVRCGFVIDGQLIHCHTFHHANQLESVYMTTAILPVRYEIENTTAGSAATLQQICSSVISEGGYELRGTGNYASTGVLPAQLLTVDNSGFVPLISVRLKSTPNRLDALAILSNVSIISDTAANFEIALVKGGSLTNADWTSAGNDSSVEYDISATAFTGGERILGKVVGISNQSASTIDLSSDLFSLQFERNGLTNEPIVYTIIAISDSNGASVGASIDWEEIT